MKFCQVTSFNALQVSFEQIYYAFAERPDKLFWARLKKLAVAFAGKRLEHLESTETLCVHHPKTSSVSTGQGYKTSMGLTGPLFVQ